MANKECVRGLLNYGPTVKQISDPEFWRGAPPEIRSGEWVDALEAALRCMEDQIEWCREVYDDAEMDKRGQRYKLIIEKLIAAERSRASTGGDMPLRGSNRR